MIIDIFRNYGCLAAEKRAVYTYGAKHATAVCADVITVKIPDGWECGENYLGELILTAPWGETYLPNEVLQGDECPYFYAVDDAGRGHREKLEIVS